MAKKNSNLPKPIPPSQDYLSNRNLFKSLSDDAIKEGDIVDPKFVEQRAELNPTVYSGADVLYKPLEEGYFDKYESYIDKGTLRGGQLDIEDLNKLRAENQSNWEQLGNATGRVALNIVPQIMGGFASMIDVPGYFDAEHAANNAIVNWADNIKKTVDQEWLPIYEESPNKALQLGDWAWWMTRGSGLVESIGSFLAQGYGVGKFASLAAKSLGTLGRARKLAKAVTGLEIGAESGATGANALGTLTSATMLNQSEAVIEATQVYKNTLEDALNKGLPYEKARIKASQAAATTMNINRLNIALNLTSAKAFMNPRQFTRNLIEKGTMATTLGELTKEGSQEALEELVNHVASKKGEAVGKGKDYGWADAYRDMGSAEGIEAAILGAIGGIAQTGGTTAMQYSKYGPGSTTDENGNRISLKQKQATDYEKQQQIIKEMEANGVKATDTMQNLQDRILFEEKLKKAAEEGNQAEVDRLFNQRFEKQAYDAFSTGTTEILENLYKEEAQKDPNEVGQEHIDRANENIKNLRTLEEIYNNYEGYENTQDIMMNRANKMRLDAAHSQTDALKKNTDLDLGIQVREIAKKYNFKNEKEYINKEEGVEVSRGTRTITSPLTYSLSNLEENTGDTEQNQETYNRFLEEVQSLPSYQASKAYEKQLDSLNKTRINTDKEYGVLISPQEQARVVNQKEEKQKLQELKEALNSPDISISDVEKLKTQTEDPEFQKQADAKIANLKTAAAAEAKANQVKLTIAQTKEKIKNATLDNTAQLAEEINQLEIDDNSKKILQDALINQVNKLNGIETDPEEDIEEDPFSAFEQGENIQNIVNKENESFETEIPKDLPNPNTEAQNVEQEVADNARSLVQSDTTTIEGQDAQGNLIYNYDRASEGYNRGAFLSREFNQTEDQGVVNREEFTNEVKDNLDILDPDKHLAGEELILDVDLEYTGEKYDPKSTTRETISWENRLIELSELAKQKGVPLTQLPEYIAEVPIVAKAKDGTVLFYVHDNSWYKAENLNATPEEIAEDKARNYKIREAIVAKGATKSKISYKSYGRLFKTADGKKLSLDEAMPDPNLIIAVGKDGAFESSTNLPTEMIDGKKVAPRIMGSAKIQDGRPYALVRVGQATYMPIPLQRKPITKEVADTVIFAIEAYLSGDPNNATVANVLKATGYNISEIEGLRKYIAQFIYLYPTKGNEGLETILTQGGLNGPLKSNMPLITITGNSIEFGKPGVNMGIQSKKKAGSISKNFKNNAAALAKLRGLLISGNVLSSVSISNLQLNRNTALILNEAGDTQTVNYKDHVKASTETNTLSVNIGTEENPKWVYTIQPTVLFDTSFAGIDSSQRIRAFKPTQKVAPTAPATKTDLEPIRAEVEKLTDEFELEDAFADTDVESWGIFDEDNNGNLNPEITVVVEGENFTKAELLRSKDPRDPKIQKIVEEIDRVQKLLDDEIRTIPRPATSKTTSDIEAQKADIERRRQEGTNARGTTYKAETTEKDGLTITKYSEFRPDGRQISKGGRIMAPSDFIEEYNITDQDMLDSLEGATEIKVYEVRVGKDGKSGISIQTTFPEGNAEIEVAGAELAALEQQPAQPVQEPTAEEEVEETLVDKQAKEFLENTPGVSEENLLNIYNSITATEDSERIPDEVITQIGFASREDAANVLTRALEIFKENAKETKTITLANGQKVTVNKNTQDTTDINDDESDYSLPALETPIEGEDGKTYLDKINSEIEDLVIRGIDPSTQESLLTYLAADIMQQAINAKETKGKGSVDTKPIFEKHLKSFKELAKFYKENGLPNRAKRIEAVIDQFDKVRRLTNQKISLFTTGTVQENLNLDDNESSVGLEKVVYSDDWAFTVSSKSTASADLKRFFAFIEAQDENGTMTNMLGFPEIMSFDQIYDTLHEILANKPADFNFMMETLELYKQKFPWIQSVTEKLKNASDKIKNEFVSDMAKHHIDMEFVMWSKDKNGNYSLQRWSSNSSSIEQRLRNIWRSNMKGIGTKSNVVTVDEDNNYVFDEAEVKRLVDQAAEFAADPSAVTNNDLANWLGSLGIIITDDTYQDLRDGKFNNKGKKTWAKLFTDSNGLIKVLAKELKGYADSNILVEDAELLNDSVVKALAKLDAMNNMNTFSNSFQAGGKTIYSYGNNNFLVNRMRDLIAYNEVEKKFINQNLIDNLKSISFTKDSLWLNELTDEDALGDFTRNTLNIGYLSLEALKKKYTKPQDNRKLNNLTPAEHEVTKIGLFQNKSSKILNNQVRRIVDFFYPTMSDKTTMLTFRALAYEFKMSDGVISDENAELLFKAIVEPELNRIRDKQATNIKGYEPNYFYFLPGLNSLPVIINDVEKTYLDLAKDKDSSIYSKEAKEAVMNHIKEVFEQLVDNKMEDWRKLNIGQTVKDTKGRVVEKHSFLDKSYMADIAQGSVRYAAGDFVFNYLIANAEATKLFAGDPALYAKFNSNNSLEDNLLESYINMGKRLAGDIAPGLELADSTNNMYYQVFLADEKIDSKNLTDEVQKEFFTRIIDTYEKDYGGIEGSDAQEYTTWKEHLFVMKQLGRLTDRQYNTIYDKLESQTKNGVTEGNKLSFKEMETVLQPIKPVYVGNSTDTNDNTDRRIYVKSSSFPLIPELTTGLQIDKVRQGLEKFEESKKNEIGPDGKQLFIRASFGTANKVGAIKNPIKVFNADGTVVDNFEITDTNTLKLERKNFRIQQDVPYKREKDSINIGTQERKLLFSDILDVQIEKGVTGQDLMNEYNQNYEDLFKYAQEKLAKRLGLIEEVTTGEDLSSLTVIPESDLISEVETFNNELKAIKSPVAKIQKREEFTDKIGADNLERINFINKNFDSIVEALAAGKVNIFFDENNEFKKCD
jgi:hypothetical protein